MNTDRPQPPPFIPEPTAPRVEPDLPESLDLRALFAALLRGPRALLRRLADPGHPMKAKPAKATRPAADHSSAKRRKKKKPAPRDPLFEALRQELGL